MSKQLASLYVRRGTCFVTTMNCSADGFWFESDPLFVEDEVDVTVLSGRILQALAASRSNVPSPRRDKLVSRLPGLAGVKSYGAFMKGVVHVSILSDGDEIKLTPTRNRGMSKGFESKSEEVVIVKSADALPLSLANVLQAAE
jgi:hypothetical protein